MKNINWKKILYKTEVGLKKHSPAILSGIAVIGVVASTVTAVQATPKAIALLENMESEKGEELSKSEIIQTVMAVYIPTAIICISTIACILGANALNKKQQASLVSAYGLLNESFKKYITAANNIYGEDADKKIKSEMAKMTYISCDGYSIYSPDMDLESDNVLFYDFYSQRYFNTTVSAVLNAQYHLNRNLVLRGEVSVNEFYKFLGISTIEGGDDIGWNMDYLMIGGLLWLDFENEYTKLEDGMECCIVSACIDPIPFSMMDVDT